jgi:hypothetical protein
VANAAGLAEDAVIATLNRPRKDRTMNTTRTPRFFALALSLVMTLSIFSGVVSLASPEQADLMLVQHQSTLRA